MLITLEDYLRSHCNNNKAELADKLGRLPQNINNMFNSSADWRVDVDKNLLVQVRGKVRERR